MMESLRSFFGLSRTSGKRVVVGHRQQFDAQDVDHIRESETILTALYHLSKSYAGTQHHAKLKLVYEKTKNIHHYLVSRNRVHELALFHLRNTEHFINTFKAIIEVHMRHSGPSSPPSEAQSKAKEKVEAPYVNGNQEKKKNQTGIPEMAEMLINLIGKKVLEQPHRNGRHFGGNSIPVWRARRAPERDPFVRRTTEQEARNSRMDIPRMDIVGTAVHEADVPGTVVPEITLSTYEKATYSRKETTEGLSVKEISYISTPKEKEDFLQFVSDRLEIRNLSYLGNALLKIPDDKGFVEKRIVPIIHWQGFLYALDLPDFRLFPVKMYRKSL